jgi:macrodomain Ter protein organizer (MatP/YcbG family)
MRRIFEKRMTIRSILLPLEVWQQLQAKYGKQLQTKLREKIFELLNETGAPTQ